MKKNLITLGVFFILLSTAFKPAPIPEAFASINNTNQLDQYSTQTASQVFSLNDLGFSEQIHLRGPYQEVSIMFALPADWQVGDSLLLELELTSEFRSLLEAFTSEETAETANLEKGNLRAEMNGSPIGEIEISGNGSSRVSFTAPRRFVHQNTRANKIVISWDSRTGCDQGATSIITISPESELTIPHTTKETSLIFKDFPSPFLYEHSFVKNPIAIIIPDKPDEDILSALMAVSAAFGRLGMNNFDFELIVASDLNQKKHDDYHFIFIGSVKDLREIIGVRMGGDELDVPHAVAGTDNGFLSYINSPWNPGRTILIVSGESGPGVKKAGSVLASDNLLPFTNGSSTVIQNLAGSLKAEQYQIDHKLRDLAPEESLRTTKIYETKVEIPFLIPGDVQISPESYLELYFRHSQLIDYFQSNITIYVNDMPIGTMRFSDISAENGLNRIILPPKVLKPLRNEMLISFTVIPRDICADERSGNYWITVFGNSYLHLPPVLDLINESNMYSLKNLPAVLLRDESFSNLKFVVDRNEKLDWKYASQMSFSLGRFNLSDIFQPSVQFSTTGVDFKENTDYVIIGMMDEIPEESGANKYLPLPYRPDGTLTNEAFEGIQYEIDSGQDIGIVESVLLPEQQITILGIFGNSTNGLKSAVSNLIAGLSTSDNENINVAIIDGVGDIHYYLIEHKIFPDNGEIGPSGAWISQLLGDIHNNLTILLLVIFISITIAFMIWTKKGTSRRS